MILGVQALPSIIGNVINGVIVAAGLLGVGLLAPVFAVESLLFTGGLIGSVVGVAVAGYVATFASSVVRHAVKMRKYNQSVAQNHGLTQGSALDQLSLAEEGGCNAAAI